MDQEKKLFSAIIKDTIYGTCHKDIGKLLENKLDWARFKNLTIYHELTPFVYFSLKNFTIYIPDDLQEFFKKTYYFAIAHCHNLWGEFLRILTAFEQTGIILLPLKGIALLEDLYQDKPVRPMIDMDLLVKREDLKKAEGVLYDLGYQKKIDGLKEEYWLEKQCHIEFCGGAKRSFLLDLHWSLDFKRKGRYILPELWNRTRDINVDSRKIKVLSPEDTLFSLALHNRRFGNTLSLKNVYDVALLLHRYSHSFDWDYCLDMSRKYSLCASLFFILYQAEFLVEIKVPQKVRSELGLSTLKKKNIQNFIEKNSFPVKDEVISNKNLYLKSHFLLYDSLWEPIEYILNIPKEQFAKYYGLKSYTKKTNVLYNLRFIYIPFKAISHLIKRREPECMEDLSMFKRVDDDLWQGC